jgi:hypothetical protein
MHTNYRRFPESFDRAFIMISVAKRCGPKLMVGTMSAITEPAPTAAPALLVSPVRQPVFSQPRPHRVAANCILGSRGLFLSSLALCSYLRY